jgi:O-antigen/teichoic acid export membrane protein
MNQASMPPWLTDLTSRPVMRAAASLFGTTVITSVLGLAYSVAAARLFPISQTGVALPALAAMQLLGQVGLVGITTMLIARMAREGSEPGLVMAGAITAMVVTFALGAAFVALQSVFNTHLGPMGHGVLGPALFSFGCGITAFTLVLDQATVGLGRTNIQLTRNGVFSAVKLLLLPAAALLPISGAIAIYATWTVGNLFSLFAYLRGVRRAGIRPQIRPDFRALHGQRWTVMTHHWLNIADQAPRLLITVLVAALLTRQDAAAFYNANLLVAFPTVIPVHLTLALFALPKGQVDRLANEARATLRVSFAVGLASAVIVPIIAYPMLLLFGPRYVIATGAMAVLGLNVIPYTVKVHYASIERVRGHLRRAAIVSSIGAVLEIGLCIVGGLQFGMVGVSGGLVIGLCVEAVFLWPIVARAARVPVLGVPSWLWRHDEGLGSSVVEVAAHLPEMPGVDPSGELDVDSHAELVGGAHDPNEGAPRFVLDLPQERERAAGYPRMNLPDDLHLITLTDPRVISAIYALCGGRSPGFMSEDLPLREALALPGVKTLAVVDRRQAVVGLGTVLRDGCEAHLIGLACRTDAAAGPAVAAMIHESLVSSLINEGFERLWLNGRRNDRSYLSQMAVAGAYRLAARAPAH